MPDTIFTVELPFVESNKELGEIRKLFPKYDPCFIGSGCCKERRAKIDKLWANYKPFADPHFLSQIKTNFHQRSWELYVGNVLLEKKLPIESEDEGPDFVIKDIGYIECVAPTKGNPNMPDSVPTMCVATKPEEIRLQDAPVDKMILRITQVIKDKALNQYENWKRKNWFNSKMPLVIALNTSDLSHVEDPNMPNVLKALFGFQFMQINVKTGASSFSHRNEVPKTNNAAVTVNYFVSRDFNFLSGVLFSDKTVLNHPVDLGDDCIFVNNPFAKNPMNENFVNLFKNWTASSVNDQIRLKKNY